MTQGCAIGERREVEWRTRASAEVQLQIETLYRSQKTLDEVVRWGLAQKPPQLVLDVVVQDEYTHDVVMGHPSGVYLVYDTT
ncbi:MAG: hypothetical protein IPK82_32840 [Polyangiaceae bacterium]|nr:hypothetical protein [Polyangiaceae bacterium]